MEMESSQSAEDDSKHPGEESRNSFMLPLKVQVVCWFATIFSTDRITMTDVRRTIRWITGQRPSWREVFKCWAFVNSLVWLFALWLSSEKNCHEATSVAHSIYRAFSLARNFRDNILCLRAYPELLEIKDQKFKDRDWSYFDAHGGILFDKGVVKMLTLLMQFSKDDLQTYDDLLLLLADERLKSSVRIKESAAPLVDAMHRLVTSLMRFRGHRKHLLSRLETYCHNLQMYSIGLCGQKPIENLALAQKAFHALGELEPRQKNLHKIALVVYKAAVYANDGSKSVYQARCRIHATTVVVQQPALPTRTELAKELFPQLDPERLRAEMRELYRQGFKDGIASVSNIKEMIADSERKIDRKIARAEERAIKAQDEPAPMYTPGRRGRVQEDENLYLFERAIIYQLAHGGKKCSAHNACTKAFEIRKGGYASARSLYEYWRNHPSDVISARDAFLKMVDNGEKTAKQIAKEYHIECLRGFTWN